MLCAQKSNQNVYNVSLFVLITKTLQKQNTIATCPSPHTSYPFTNQLFDTLCCHFTIITFSLQSHLIGSPHVFKSKQQPKHSPFNVVHTVSHILHTMQFAIWCHVYCQHHTFR